MDLYIDQTDLLLGTTQVKEGIQESKDEGQLVKCVLFEGQEDDLDQENAQAVCTFMQQTPTVQNLILSCPLSEQALGTLVAFLQSNRHFLKHIRCGRAMFMSHDEGDRILECICRGFGCVEHHDERGINHDDAIRTATSSKSSVARLDVWNTAISNESQQSQLQRMLQAKQNFEILDFSQCYFGENQHVPGLLQGLECQSNLQELILRGCSITDAALAAVIRIAHSLSEKHKLVKLDLGCRPFGLASMEALEAMLLSTETNVQELHLSKVFFANPVFMDRLKDILCHDNLSLHWIFCGMRKTSNSVLQECCQRNRNLVHVQKLLNSPESLRNGIWTRALHRVDREDGSAPRVGATPLFLALLGLAGRRPLAQNTPNASAFLHDS